MAFSITGSISSLHISWLTDIDRIIDNPFLFALIVITLGLILIRQRKERARFVIALLVTFIAATAIKMALAVPRPCSMIGDACPTDFSLPSSHAAIAFTLMLVLLEKKSFPIGMVFALFVAFSRINFGVHTFEDIAAALPLAFISVFLVEKLYERCKICQGK